MYLLINGTIALRGALTSLLQQTCLRFVDEEQASVVDTFKYDMQPVKLADVSADPDGSLASCESLRMHVASFSKKQRLIVSSCPLQTNILNDLTRHIDEKCSKCDAFLVQCGGTSLCRENFQKVRSSFAFSSLC